MRRSYPSLVSLEMREFLREVAGRLGEIEEDLLKERNETNSELDQPMKEGQHLIGLRKDCQKLSQDLSRRSIGVKSGTDEVFSQYNDLAYDDRTAAERINSQAKGFGIERPRLRRMSAIRNQNTLIYIVINLKAIQRVRAAKPKARSPCIML